MSTFNISAYYRLILFYIIVVHLVSSTITIKNNAFLIINSENTQYSEAYMPVSYTHLDVYKRQLPNQCHSPVG